MDRVIYCRDGRREQQCHNANEDGDVCALPFGHTCRCAFRNNIIVNGYRRADARRAAEAAKEPPADGFRVWLSRERN